MPRFLQQILQISRAGEWWEYKLLPLLAIFYASAVLLDLSPKAWLIGAATLLGAVIPGAIFVSVVNDLTDRADDEAAGKPNRMAKAHPVARLLMLCAPIAIGIAWCLYWRGKPTLLLPYLAAWLAFAAYSVPPLRLKRRGWAGVLADASGAHLFPALLAVGIAADTAGRAIPAFWLVAVGLCAFAYGLRGILWHQLIDSENDRLANVRTLAMRYSAKSLQALTHWLIFPIEAAALLALLSLLSEPLAWAALALYLLSVVQRVRLWKMRAILVVNASSSLIFMAEFYAVLLPLSLLITLACREPLAGIVAIVIHLLLFRITLWRTARDIARVEFAQGWWIREWLAAKIKS